eukprot:3594929-Amphidinium_carterae.1
MLQLWRGCWWMEHLVLRHIPRNSTLLQWRSALSWQSAVAWQSSVLYSRVPIKSVFNQSECSGLVGHSASHLVHGFDTLCHTQLTPLKQEAKSSPKAFSHPPMAAAATSTPELCTLSFCNGFFEATSGMCLGALLDSSNDTEAERAKENKFD